VIDLNRGDRVSFDAHLAEVEREDDAVRVLMEGQSTIWSSCWRREGKTSFVKSSRRSRSGSLVLPGARRPATLYTRARLHNPGLPMHAEPTVQELRALVADFEPGRGHVLPALHRVQETYGYVSAQAMEVIARQLNSTAALIYGAASFYTDIRTKPRPQNEIAWCSGPTCRLLGGDKIREAMQQVLELPLGGHSDDHAYGLHIGQCNGTCHEAPMVWVNGRVAGPLSVADAIRLAREVKGE
jgi:NADH:ubiquinone oxidoreductase subunit E